MINLISHFRRDVDEGRQDDEGVPVIGRSAAFYPARDALGLTCRQLILSNL